VLYKLKTLPEPIYKIFNELILDDSIKEIWLIGSQASDNARPDSDWDLLVFSQREAVVRQPRSNIVDVLWYGPSGKVLLEGQLAEYSFDFSDFQWEENEAGIAMYRGRKFLDSKAATIRDTSQSIQKFVKSSAILLWKNSEKN
jgi:predicted nucleotidyltransferase